MVISPISWRIRFRQNDPGEHWRFQPDHVTMVGFLLPEKSLRLDKPPKMDILEVYHTPLGYNL